MKVPVHAVSAGREQGSTWLITLADLVALLLTFFVLIFSMSTIRSDRWDALVEGMQAGVPAIAPAAETNPPATGNVPLADAPLGIHLGYLDSVLHEHLWRDPVLSHAIVARVRDALVISLPAHLLFASGSDALREGARPALSRLGGFLGNLRNEIAVIGHTDPDPIIAGRFPSNWELSLARASSVAAVLRQAGYRRDIQVLGAGDGHFADISTELELSRRRSLARRVDLLIRDTKGL